MLVRAGTAGDSHPDVLQAFFETDKRVECAVRGQLRLFITLKHVDHPNIVMNL